MSLNCVPNQTVESAEGLDLVRLSTYGPKEREADVVLLSPHTGNSRKLLEKLNGSFDDSPAVVDEYLRIDADFGADALACGLAREIALISGDLRVDVVEVLYERGIVDANRVSKVARRNVLGYGHISRHNDFLRQIHDKTLEIVDKALAQVDRTKGLFLDVHSMAPYSPDGLVGEHPGLLKAYNFAYGRSRRGSRRYLDLVTSIPGEGTIANPILFENVQSALDNAGMDFRLNNPYPRPGYPAGNIRSMSYMLAHPGLALDFPKDQLSKGVAEDDGWDIANLEVDGNKVENIVRILAGAVIQSLKGIRA